MCVVFFSLKKKKKIEHFLNKNTANKKVNSFMIESTLSSPFGKNKNLRFLKKKRKKNIPFFEYKKKSGELRNFLNLKNRKVQIFLFFLSSFFKEKKGFSFFFFPFKLFFCFFYTGQKNNLIFLLKDKYSLELKYKNACL